MMKNYEGVLKIDGEVGNEEKYDPRSYMKLGEAALAERVKKAVTDLRAVGTTLFGSCGKKTDKNGVGIASSPQRVSRGRCGNVNE
jgi:hypothetical protein